MNRVARLGDYTLDRWQELRYLSALCWSICQVSVRRRTWVHTVRAELVRQIYSSGVQATRFGLGFAAVTALLAARWFGRQVADFHPPEVPEAASPGSAPPGSAPPGSAPPGPAPPGSAPPSEPRIEG